MSYLCAPFFNENILLKYAKNLTGYTLGELSNALLNNIPKNINYDKGFTGRLIEKYLGVLSNNQPRQDFYAIGIELKTIPINQYGYPLEDTFICTAPLVKNTGLIWEHSYFYKKIKRILWVPILAEKNIIVSKRVIQKPFLWSPTRIERTLIKKDWEEFMDLIVLGKIETLTGEYGQVLRILKKSNAKYIKGIGEKGESINTPIRTLYFRKKFTYPILSRFLNLSI
ncbi:MAG TPA: DNA mismatch repair endonuclease MutH [Buchnera sp. (in: enterobacteria)]|nr:DNA mismatch repair endonuclease MutH [Buchnera sp. (in: enterobacteria)]